MEKQSATLDPPLIDQNLDILITARWLIELCPAGTATAAVAW